MNLAKKNKGHDLENICLCERKFAQVFLFKTLMLPAPIMALIMIIRAFKSRMTTGSSGHDIFFTSGFLQI